jgi:hypothetical protein
MIKVLGVYRKGCGPASRKLLIRLPRIDRSGTYRNLTNRLRARVPLPAPHKTEGPRNRGLFRGPQRLPRSPALFADRTGNALVAHAHVAARLRAQGLPSTGTTHCAAGGWRVMPRWRLCRPPRRYVWTLWRSLLIAVRAHRVHEDPLVRGRCMALLDPQPMQDQPSGVQRYRARSRAADLPGG